MPASQAPIAAATDGHQYFAGVAPASGRVRRGGREEEEGGGKRQEVHDACLSNQHGSCDLRVGLTNHMTISTHCHLGP